MPASRIHHADSLPRRIFRVLPLSVKFKNFIKRVHRNLQGYDKSVFNHPGTLDRQYEREKTVELILKEFQPRAIVETGSFLGAGTKFFLTHTQQEAIYSCEINPRFFRFCQERFQKQPRVTIVHGNSVDFLKSCSIDDGEPDAHLFFYLDAHGEKYLPLADEVDIIFTRWRNALVVVDDFLVPFDKGYNYDDYGDGVVLNAAYLSKVGKQLQIFYPNVPSDSETGPKRGSCFVCLPYSTAHALLLRHPDRFRSDA